MKHPMTSLAAAGLALATVTPEPASAQGYQVDCAMLLQRDKQGEIPRQSG